MSFRVESGGSELRVETYRAPAAAIGPESPHPPMQKKTVRRFNLQDTAQLARNHGIRAGYGSGGTILPYRMQSHYSRDLPVTDFQSVVLENRHLRATFLPQLGGRLWSLVHKASGRELLDVNPVIQLANLACRDAWFSGGVEWNFCQMGYHTPLTCAPLFAAAHQLDDGTPVLRLWEWERRQQFAYQIDAWLPPDATFLRVRMRVGNGHSDTLPMYQWSNIAVLEMPDTRVLTPSESVFINRYEPRGVRTTLEPMPVCDERDVSYPATGGYARDYFFNLRAGRPWIAALQGDGRGLVQTSTERQMGRKLFIWGASEGGRRWQEFLSVPGHNYIEIQAGLVRTQIESVPMPAGAVWEWMEAYGLMEGDPARTHGPDWQVATGAVQAQLDAALPSGTLERELADTAGMAARAPNRILQQGSGWGALERQCREARGQPLPWAPGVAFDDAALGKAQAPWLALLKSGALPVRSPNAEPGDFLVGHAWRRMLEASAKTEAGNHWLSWFHLGVMRYADQSSDAGAARAWERSLACAPNPWALRCLARLAAREENLFRASELYQQALALLPHDRDLVVETLEMLRYNGRSTEVVRVYNELPPALKAIDRVWMVRCWAALEQGDYRTVFDFLERLEGFAHVREGETSLTSLWFRAHELQVAEREGRPVDHALRKRVRREFPPPHAIDFRMASVSIEEEIRMEEKMDRLLRKHRQKAMLIGGTPPTMEPRACLGVSQSR